MKRAAYLVALMLTAPAAQAQQVPQTDPDFPRGGISGYMFGDYYYNIKGDPNHRYNSAGQDSGQVNIDGKTVIGKDLNGIQIRRVYFQADNDLSIKYSTRFRLEVDGKSLSSDGKLGVNVKAAYLLAKNAIPRGNFLFGLIGTPVWENSEEFWQYRSIEKTIADFRGLGSAADLGVEMKGFLDAAHKVGYAAMVGDGTGQKPEDNRFKKAYLSVPLNPTPAIKIEPYVDYEWAFGGMGRATYKLFAGYSLKRGAVGLELVDRVNHSPTGPNKEPFGVSVFGRMAPCPKVAVFGRYDRWQPDKKGPNRVDNDLYIAGLDWQPHKDVHIMPNVEITQYRAVGTGVVSDNHDVQARATFYYKFTKP